MKLYVFGIGGTGARVLKSLTMLLASGIEFDVDSIVPVIIDPDEAAADLTRMVSQMRKYQNVRNNLSFSNTNKNNFFKTNIEELLPGYRLKLDNTRNVKFDEYMETSSMSESNKAFVDMLFSEDNLKSDMQVGFKGNPNIGSIVLNQFADSEQFKQITSTFKQGDRIFIISSIFGGTGASGFPLLLKNLRNIGGNHPAASLIKDSPIGAISVLPYFSVTPDNESKIDASTFISKTKAALTYYERTISDTNALNSLYYIADTLSNQYENHEGGTEQLNKAHFIELAAALAILDFTKIKDEDLLVVNGKAINPKYKEFGIENGSKVLNFRDVGSVVCSQIQRPLTKFTLFSKYMKEHYKDARDQPYVKDNKFDDKFEGSFVSTLNSFMTDYLEWLKEMKNNERSFEPFELTEKKNDVFSLVKGYKPTRSFFKNNYSLFDSMLNSIQRKIANGRSKEQILIELFYLTTDKLISEKYNF